MFVQKRNDRFDVVLLDDVKHLRTFNKDTIQHLQNAWQLKYAHIHYRLKYIFKKKSFQSARTHKIDQVYSIYQRIPKKKIIMDSSF